MKLLVFTPYFFPKTGGVEEHTFRVYSGLVKLGYHITIVTTKYNSQASTNEIINGLNVIRIPYQFKISNSPVSFRWLKIFKSIIDQEKPDLITTHSPVPYMADLVILRNHHIPIILKYHSGSMQKKDHPFLNLIILVYEHILLKLVIARVDQLICTSDFVRNKFLPEFKSKSTTITPGVDTSLFIPADSLSKKPFSILYVGRLDKTSEWKGINYLLQAFAQVQTSYPDSRLSIVGDGDDMDHQKEICKTLSIEKNVDFHGSLKGKLLVKKYQESTLLVLPSTSSAESFGMVLIEAMACKKPVIGSNIGGIPYVIDNGQNGLLVPPADPSALAEAIEKLLSSPKLAEKFGENGYKKVIANYSWDKKILQTKKIIDLVYQRNLHEAHTK